MLYADFSRIFYLVLRVLMVAEVFAGLEVALEVAGDDLFDGCGGGADDDVDIFFGEQIASALAHAAGDDEVDVAIGEPGGQQTGLVGRGVDEFSLDDFLVFEIAVDQGELGAMAEMQGEFAFGGGQGDAHGLTPIGAGGRRRCFWLNAWFFFNAKIVGRIF